MIKNPGNLTVLIAGCGSIGKRHARILNTLGVKNLLIYDNNQEQVELLKNDLPDVRIAESFEKGLEVSDVVFILTPTKLHIPMAIQAVTAGCHVFIEKPLSNDMNGVLDLEKLAEQKGKKVMIGLCFRYHEGILKAKRIVEAGTIGRLVSIRAMVGEHFPSVHPSYKSMYYAKYSGAFELVHDIDLAIWISGQEVKNVFSVYGSFSEIGTEAPDIAEILIEFEDRCVATVHLDFFQIPRRRSLELIGTQSVIIVEFASWNEYILSIYNTEKKIWELETGQTARDDMFIDEDREFLESIIRDSPIACDIREGCKSVRVLELATRKTETKNLI